MPGPVTVTVKGRFFRQGDQVLNEAQVQLARELAQQGEEHLALMLRPRPGGVYLSVSEAGRNKASTGNYRRNVHAVRRGAFYAITDDGVIYGPWLEYGRPGTRFRGYATFRRTAQWLRQQVAPTARRIMNRMTSKMNGA